ncbi:17S U2 SnRNP complex component HTATSF1 [Halyomorpha halys]|uniref:17S U2 SnRNP complex component HTATSF1 n=1 Tax=Halyomorpha halys TaxID=286706 RepID=UPI0006D5279C|nr:HIV Tat-specific factor 1 homolog [Halyomorpha halys]
MLMADDIVKLPEEKSNNPDNTDSDSKAFDKSSLRYEDGKCFYKDPVSGVDYEWKESSKEWVTNTNSDTNDYVFDGETYVYTDKKTNASYRWDKNDNKWVQNEGITLTKSKIKSNENDEEVDTDDEEKEVIRQDMSKGTYGTDGNTLTYTDPNDGSVYVWDKEKNAWFPKVDEDFLARYQLSYGFSNPDTQEKNEPPVKEDSKSSIESKPNEAEALKRKAQEPAWFDVSDETNNKVYVSNLPLDITETEFVDVMQKCGLVMKDPDSGKMKVKLYTEKGSDVLKGDALCTYIKIESVELALNILDGYELRGNKIHVERAKFTMKGDSYDPSLKPKKKKRKDREKIKKMQEKLFDWRPEKIVGERAKHEKVVIIKNLFEPKIFDEDVSLILEYQEDLREECRKCGDVRKVMLYDRHPEGVAQVTFKEPEAADACVQLLNNRWFGKRQITAETWDGKTKFKIAETDSEISERLDNWSNFLEGKEQKKEKEDEKKSDAVVVKSVETDHDSDGTRSSAGSGDETDEGH